MEPTQTLVADANKLFREGLKRLLDDSPFEIVAEAGTAQEALAILECGLKPQLCRGLVLLDLTGADAGEVAAMRRIRAMLPDARIVVLTADLCPRRLADALEAGADGYLMKDLSALALSQSLRLVMIGEKVFPSHLATLLISGRVGSTAFEPAPPRKGLSQRELQILRCLIRGDSNKIIANHLSITEATVKVHLKSLLRKINASNRTQAAIWALSNGFGAEATSAPIASIA
ncbi:MAG: response regulator transcription factor [Azospirillaceae bacterium]|nr:response regulator transcription factor [Azospirillaceae bacterium]